MNITLRHEIKYEINLSDMFALRHRLTAAASPDPNAPDGKYFVRSLYFDNVYDKALWDKINGVPKREKFRIRFYNGDTSFIRLEKKCKWDDMGSKTSAPLTPGQAAAIACGDNTWLETAEHPLLRELYRKMLTEGLFPRSVVDYTREPFVYPAGNVRVTLDYNIRSGLCCEDFLSERCVTVPVTSAVILEVKWDKYLPDIIRMAVSLDSRQAGAFSKYASGRYDVRGQ
ncbi:MAG: polyphosphate polymerase domain-containing protein [Ruminococcus sp.]|nr:polyphosphate polymerase domain-containing protein [Ruminococcus sp.]